MVIARVLRSVSPRLLVAMVFLAAVPFLGMSSEACQSAANAGKVNFCDNAPGSRTGFYAQHANAQECVIAAYACLGHPRDSQAVGDFDPRQRTIVGVIYQGWGDDWCGPEAGNGQVNLTDVCNGRQGLINHITATNFSRVVIETGIEQENQPFQDRLGDTQYYCETSGGCIALYVPISFYAQLFENPNRLVFDEDKNSNISERDKQMLRYYLQGPSGVYAKGSGARIGNNGYGDQMTNFVLNENHPDNLIYEILSTVSTIVNASVGAAAAIEGGFEAAENALVSSGLDALKPAIEHAIDFGAHLLN